LSTSILIAITQVVSYFGLMAPFAAWLERVAYQLVAPREKDTEKRELLVKAADG